MQPPNAVEVADRHREAAASIMERTCMHSSLDKWEERIAESLADLEAATMEKACAVARKCQFDGRYIHEKGVAAWVEDEIRRAFAEEGGG